MNVKIKFCKKTLSKAEWTKFKSKIVNFDNTIFLAWSFLYSKGDCILSRNFRCLTKILQDKHTFIKFSINRHTQRQTDRQMYRQTDIQIHRQTD